MFFVILPYRVIKIKLGGSQKIVAKILDGCVWNFKYISRLYGRGFPLKKRNFTTNWRFNDVKRKITDKKYNNNQILYLFTLMCLMHTLSINNILKAYLGVINNHMQHIIRNANRTRLTMVYNTNFQVHFICYTSFINTIFEKTPQLEVTMFRILLAR